MRSSLFSKKRAMSVNVKKDLLTRRSREDVEVIQVSAGFEGTEMPFRAFRVPSRPSLTFDVFFDEDEMRSANHSACRQSPYGTTLHNR